MTTQLRRILDLVRRTGDRMIVTDPEGKDAYVIMGLDQYERLLGSLTSSVPSPPSSPSVPPISSPPSDVWEALPPAGSQAETWDLGKLNPDEQKDLEAQYNAYLREKEVKKPVAQAKNSPAQSVPAATAKKKEEEFGEEQFYLEPI